MGLFTTDFMPPTQFEQESEFMEVMGQEIHRLDLFPRPQLCDFRARLIDEEVNKELLPALAKYKQAPSLENLVKVFDGAIDAVYVIMGLCTAFGLPFDKGFQIVQDANMKKVCPDGTVMRREDGKVLKPPGWEDPKPQLFALLMSYYALNRKDQENPTAQEKP